MIKNEGPRGKPRGIGQGLFSLLRRKRRGMNPYKKIHGFNIPPALAAFLLLVFLAVAPDTALAAGGGGEGGFIPPIWTVLPFLGILFSIALFPLFANHFWEHHYPKISIFWLVLAVILMAISVPSDTTFTEAFGARFFSTGEEYIAFIILLGSLFVISGGIYIAGDINGSPTVNTVIILIGALLASLIGTTGAAMLLIRPILRANAKRTYQSHVVLFFIFLVCNIGGSLTPIGDPPLFLGFLQGIPFEWTLALTPHWIFAVVAVLVIFFAFDTFLYRREGLHKVASGPKGEPVRIHGSINFLLLLGVVGLVVMSGVVHIGEPISFFGLGVFHIPALIRDGGQIVLAGISMLITTKFIRESNNFNFGPIKEVAYLFIGIFAAMIPALMLLNARGSELGLDSPAGYFWATGILSSFLDNAPTYLTFLATAMGSLGIETAIGMTTDPAAENILIGISVGAVFMGAMTYIGNGPNFMVKAIAEGSGIRMPSFFGYMVYSILILLPVFVLVSLIFF